MTSVRRGNHVAPASLRLHCHQQSQYDALGRDEGPYGFVNSIAREVALDLAGEGIETEFRYPDDRSIGTSEGWRQQ